MIMRPCRPQRCYTPVLSYSRFSELCELGRNWPKKGFPGGSGEKDKASVVQTDIEASNGVIHVIDTVLLPPLDQKKH